MDTWLRFRYVLEDKSRHKFKPECSKAQSLLRVRVVCFKAAAQTA